MKTAHQIRKEHIQSLVANHKGGVAGFAGDIGRTENQVRQWLSSKPIGNNLARDLEQALGYQEGTLDQPLTEAEQGTVSQSHRLDLDRLVAAYQLLSQIYAEEGKQYDLATEPDLFRLAYEVLHEYASPLGASQFVSIIKRIEKRRAERRDGQQQTGRAGSAHQKASTRGAA